jgi:hypothetical protein
MTLLFVDGFDHYTDNTGAENISTVLNRKWSANNGSWFNGVGRFDPGSTVTPGDMSTGNFSSGRNITSPTFVDSTTTVLGWAYKPVAMGTSAELMRTLDNGTIQCRLLKSITGNLQFQRNITTLGEGTRTLHANVWYFIEVKMTINNTTGSFEVRINGQTEISGTNVDTQQTANSTVDAFRITLGGGGVIDDLYFLNDSGSTNNDFLGDVRIQTLFPDGAGNSTNWAVTGAASNYQAVDEFEADDDTTYVSTSTATDKDTYSFENLSTSVDTVYAVGTNILARKDDAGSRIAVQTTRSGGTDFDGATISLADNYEYVQEIRETDPATGSQWVNTDVDSAEFGYKLNS